MSILALLRLPRAFLAISAVLAGYGLFRFYANTAGNQRVVPYLLIAGALLAMADAAWTLIFQTAKENVFPEGPNSGLSIGSACLLAGFLTIAGLMCAMTGGFASFRTGGVLVLVILFKAALFRNVEIITPLLHGLIGGLVFILGMTAHPSFMEMLNIRETRLPPTFFAVYTAITFVLQQVKESSHPRAIPDSDDLDNETASRLLTLRDDTIDRVVAWVGGLALIAIPLIAAWIMPWRWLSWVILGFLAITLLFRLIPVLVYRTRKDLNNFIDSSTRGGAYLNAGIVATIGEYQMREIYDGWELPLPSNEELVAVVIILILAAPAWLLRKTAPEGD